MQRQIFLVGAGVAAAAGAGVHWLARSRDYDAAAALLWRHRASASGAEFADRVHCATMAANSHNAQAWHFRPTPTGVAISPDFDRSLPVADADNHQLYASLGCAAENLMRVAADRGSQPDRTGARADRGGDDDAGCRPGFRGGAAIVAAFQCRRGSR
ncbi:hypothetical protein [Accumulibacter sp.]|uniref:hypothetical protein n=1 Tax=Accumulibacter sp. TaxID=2053492 RepID=UPI00159ADABF|nr:hypothetical protein [Accumulibacter sp.]QKS29284.1 MAG: hypothetical protein HT579_10435 [Candidatus Accumulibacter similis]